MPNWCTNIVRADKKVLDYVKSEQGAFDFEKIIPTPEDLKNRPEDKFDDEIFNKYGVCSLYDWRMKNWGSKENAEDRSTRTNDNEIIFYSAWNEVPEIIERLSQIFPEEEITYIYYEFGAYFAGYDVFLNGKSIWGDDLEWMLADPYDDDDYGYPVFKEIHVNAPYEVYVIVESESGDGPIYELREKSIKEIKGSD